MNDEEDVPSVLEIEQAAPEDHPHLTTYELHTLPPELISENDFRRIIEDIRQKRKLFVVEREEKLAKPRKKKETKEVKEEASLLDDI